MSSEPWLEGIDGDEVRDLINTEARVVCVVAGPGSGKTTGLKRRARRLVEGQGVEPPKIFVGTFTRAVTAELRAALGADIPVATLHSLAYELLRTNPGACQGMKLRFLLDYEADALLYDVADSVPHLENLYQRRRALRRLQSDRAERQAPHDAAFAASVRAWLVRHGGMLIGEVGYLAVLGLESEDIPPGAYDHVVIDEYQDLTAAEQALVELIWSGNGSLLVMGDNEQSVYSFRFNHPEGIEEFRDRWRGESLVEIPLPDNRRCGSEILDVANLMLAERRKPPMNFMSGIDGTVALVHWPTQQDEIDGLATYINSRPGETFLVLVPRRIIGYRLRDAIGAEAQTAFQEEVLEHPLAQARFAAASAVADPEDMVAIRAWLGLHGTEEAPASGRNCAACASLPEEVVGTELIERIANGTIAVSGDGSLQVRRRATALRDLLASSIVHDVGGAIEYFFDPGLAEAEPDAERQKWLAEDLEALRVAAHDAAGAAEHPTLRQVMNSLRYRIATRAPLVPDDVEPRVQIMTLHSAKGLEADNIIVAGAAQQMMPGAEADPDKVAEHRRLLYVAITRARRNLVVSWSRAFPFGDAMANRVASDLGVITIDGEKYVQLSRTALLPQALPGGGAGEVWLATQGQVADPQG